MHTHCIINMLCFICGSHMGHGQLRHCPIGVLRSRYTPMDMRNHSVYNIIFTLCESTALYCYTPSSYNTVAGNVINDLLKHEINEALILSACSFILRKKTMKLSSTNESVHLYCKSEGVC